MLWFLNYFFEAWYWFFHKEDGVKNIYLVGTQGRRNITVNELKKPYDHVEIEYIFNEKTYIHVLPGFHKVHGPPVILSAILNHDIDITDHVNQYLMNDLTYLMVKHIIPQKYLSTFKTLEILDEDCNSLIYRNLESRMDFLDSVNSIKRSTSCSHF